MNTKSFSEVANKVMARIERVARYEGVVTEILSRVLGDEDIPTPCIEVDTDENVNLVYELKEAPKTSRITILAAVFPSMMIFSKNEQEFIVEQMRRVGIEVYAATEHFVTCKGNSWVPYAVAVAKRANAKVEVFKEPTGGFCYKFQPDLGSWTCVDSHRITFMRHNKIEKRFERLRVKDVDDKYTRYINREQTKQGEYIPLRLKIYRSESWEHSEIEEAAVEAFLKDNGDSYIMEEMILAANFLMP